MKLSLDELLLLIEALKEKETKIRIEKEDLIKEVNEKYKDITEWDYPENPKLDELKSQHHSISALIARIKANITIGGW